jgi:hypothetical protein
MAEQISGMPTLQRRRPAKRRAARRRMPLGRQPRPQVFSLSEAEIARINGAEESLGG